MTKPETIKYLENRYNCHIERETHYRPWPWDGEYETFTVYAMDGCKWSNVIGYRSLIKDLAESKDALKRLANLNKMIANGN